MCHAWAYTHGAFTTLQRRNANVLNFVALPGIAAVRQQNRVTNRSSYLAEKFWPFHGVPHMHERSILTDGIAIYRTMFGSATKLRWNS
jgi:hypothetical protein